MQAHPLLRSFISQAVGIGLFLIAVALQCGLLMGYGHCPFGVAFGDSLCSLGFLALSGYCLWYVRQVIPIPQVQTVLALFVLLLWSVSGLLGEVLTAEVSWSSYAPTLPFRLLYGALLWIILTLWYALQQKQEEPIEAQIAPSTQQTVVPPPPPASTEVEVIDRISVKDGARIHIIDLEEILYLQASGDYVTIFTTTGQYLKEQTMKYFEQSLPSPAFVRIHRSTIVHTAQIARIELFGKETYQIRLKNGVTLRASNSGYKLLKEKLAL
ncbi:MAG: LytTR family DNA-binding domain-containing protein [Parabacteroides sp.]